MTRMQRAEQLWHRGLALRTKGVNLLREDDDKQAESRRLRNKGRALIDKAWEMKEQKETL
jgi:hypothetical protein